MSFIFLSQLSKSVLSMVENELRDGANPTNVRKRVLTESGVELKSKTLQNIKQKTIGN